jgi:hypothetical protein
MGPTVGDCIRWRHRKRPERGLLSPAMIIAEVFRLNGCHEYVAAWRSLEKFWRIARDVYGIGTATGVDIFSAN